MKTLKTTVAAFTMAIVLGFGASMANAGILINDLNGTTKANTCTSTEEKVDWGILINDIMGILINDFTGILINDRGGILINDLKGGQTNCGILIND